MKLVLVLAALAGAIASLPAHAADAPVPPCAGTPYPAAPALGEPPTVKLWYEEDIGEWRPPACMGWQVAKPNLLLAEAGKFQSADPVGSVLARFAAVSAFTQARYWSDTRSSYRPLIRTAYALDRADKTARRADFPPAELVPGGSHYVALGNTSASVLVYKLDVRERTPDRITVSLENAEDAWFLVFRVLPARGVQCLFTFERESGDVWRYHAVLRISGVIRSVARYAQSSFYEPAQALLSYLAGALPPVPEDGAPPEKH